MMEELTKGTSASQVFRALISINPLLTGRDLSLLLAEQFPGIDSAAVMVVRRWIGGGRSDGISDEDLDLAISWFLKKAGYLE